ncbi:GntR family transcriptional regulator [Anaerosolibacter carboniphilus]|uniref:GntR family transcriptional regulator n=1 Tax=Anaerosolibacter carboniphilus TaxID=1417629 RepID=A0A841L3B5_9FIRM|nr:GntR family transcriptional regulator [Anaerosolibacter carboniphilus]MBB6216879.1 GntR family transcriptional regulator [Anaerosolibacter carboniphilus]
MKIIISNASQEPIYQQISDQVKHLILKGELEAGQLLPSIRNLAKELQISVITTKRAYEELEREGFIETVGGKGTFVAGQNKELLKEKRLQLIEEALAEVIHECKALGISQDDFIRIIKLLFEEV